MKQKQLGPACRQTGLVVIPLLVIFVAALVALGYWLWREKTTSNLGSQIFKQVQKNPISGKIPETNPFAEVQTNPFKDIYPNPFDRISK